MKNYYSLSVSRTVSQLIMRVRKPKVEYKLVQLNRKNAKRVSWHIIVKIL